MDELSKIQRVAAKRLPGAPHEVWLVLDATTGQNAIAQAEIFNQAIGISHLILTKLDGTAKGGIVVGISHQLKLPIKFIGIGEGIDDLRPFNPSDFVSVDSLVLVAFVQNEDTKDVYQAAYVKFKDLLGSGIFGIHNRAGDLDYLVYPNPASGEIYLKFDQMLQRNMKVRVFNELGALIEVNLLKKGNDLFSFDVTSYRQGVYIIQVTDDQHHSRGWKRFIVIH